MTFPGPGGYKIVWEPGALHLPLSKAPSGHLCLELDHYDRLENLGGVPTKEMTPLSGARTKEDRQSAETAAAELRAVHRVGFGGGRVWGNNSDVLPTAFETDGGPVPAPPIPHPCQFERHHRRRTMIGASRNKLAETTMVSATGDAMVHEYADRDLGDLDNICGRPCVLSLWENPGGVNGIRSHDHEGECRCAYHAQNKSQNAEPG